VNIHHTVLQSQALQSVYSVLLHCSVDVTKASGQLNISPAMH